MTYKQRYYSSSPKYRSEAQQDRGKNVGKIICIAIAVFLVANAVIFFLLTSFYPAEKNSATLMTSNATVNTVSVTTDSTASKIAPHKKGLYQNVEEVSEVWSISDLDELLTKGKHPTVVVFYASWCPHCRHFAPIFSAYAKKVQTVARNLNAVIDAEKEEDGIQPYRVSFAAVDCPQVNPACDRQKVKAFPTIVGFNFNDETNTELNPQSHVGSLTEIDKLLKRVIFKHGELDDPKLAQTPPAATSIDQLLQLKKSHTMSAVTRLEDAWTSFLYFLSHELPSDILTAVQVDTLRNMCSLVKQVFAENVNRFSQSQGSKSSSFQMESNILMWQERIRFLDEFDSVFRQNAQLHSNFPVKKILEVQNKYKFDISNKFVWQGCGIPAGSSASKPGSSSTSSLRAILQSLKAVNTDAPSEDVVGYSCGLWMMFHMFTIVGPTTPLPHPLKSLALANPSEEVNSNKDVSYFAATDVRTVIHDFVGQFFRCFSCRSHFLHSFDQCFFHHCRLLPQMDTLPVTSDYDPVVGTSAVEGSAVEDVSSEEQYRRLQFWLFQLHNLVANRIVLEKEELFLYKNITSSALVQVLAAKLWPSHGTCPSCYQHKSNNNNNIQQVLLISALESYRQKLRRKRSFQSSRDGQAVIGQNMSFLTSSQTFLRGNKDNDAWIMHFDSEQEIEWLLQHVVEHVFVREEVLKFLKRTYIVDRV